MASRKQLKNIAFGLLGTFVSRNNDVRGFWGLGVLRKFAQSRKVFELRIDLLKKPSFSLFPSAVTITEVKYRQWLLTALERSRIQVDEIVRAEISLRFATFEEFPNTIRDTRGEPYVCTITITKKNGPTYLAIKVGVCSQHDPRKEYRRAT